jgi:monoamine oxidase
VVIAIPPHLASRLRYRPPLPSHRDQLTQRLGQGSIIKVHCVYPSPFWRQEGLSGSVTSDWGALRDIFDGSPPSGHHGVLAGWIEGDLARQWAERSARERKAAVLESVVRYFGERARRPIAYEELLWATEEYSGGCYSSVMPPGVWTSHGRHLRAPIGRLHWAGAETSTRWYGHMDGAVRSGERAAVEVLAALR